MELIKPSFEIYEQEIPVKKPDMSQEQYILSYKDYMYKHIERCARVCYKSEHLIKEGSAENFVNRMITSGHYATLEHGTIYLTFHITDPSVVGEEKYHQLQEKFNNLVNKYADNKYSIIKVNHYYDTCFITTNYRTIIENNWDDDLQYLCKDSVFHEKRVTVKFNSSIHFYKDLTRHRPMSYCIESTRYCNYFKEKFSSSVKFTIPTWLDPIDVTEFEKDCRAIEKIYFKWLEKGWKPEEAAYFLCQGVDADIFCTGFVKDWKHIFDLRADSHAHPVLQELMYPLKDEFTKLNYI